MKNSIKSILKFGTYYLVVLIVLASCNTEDTPKQETDFCSSIHRNDTLSLSKELEDLTSLMDTLTGVYVLEDGSGSMVARAWLSEYAEKTIDIQYFIWYVSLIRYLI